MCYSAGGCCTAIGDNSKHLGRCLKVGGMDHICIRNIVHGLFASSFGLRAGRPRISGVSALCWPCSLRMIGRDLLPTQGPTMHAARASYHSWLLAACCCCHSPAATAAAAPSASTLAKLHTAILPLAVLLSSRFFLIIIVGIIHTRLHAPSFVLNERSGLFLP
jgi:hypothetical protein